MGGVTAGFAVGVGAAAAVLAGTAVGPAYADGGAPDLTAHAGPARGTSPTTRSATMRNAPMVATHRIAKPSSAKSPAAQTFAAQKTAIPTTATKPPEPPSAAAASPAPRSRRGFSSLFANERPILHPAQNGQAAGGVVSGQLNASDPDSSPLIFTLTQNPMHGTAVVNTDGSYTYTPQSTSSSTGIADTFRVTVSDSGAGFHLHGLSGLLNMLTFGLLGSSDHTSTATVAVTVSPFGTEESPLPVGQLRPADLTFQGFFRVPAGALGDGPYDTLAYGGAALASRVVDGRRHFFLTGHRYANDPVVELIAPQSLSGTVDSAPVATLYRYWGDVYGGAKVTEEEPDPAQVNANWTEGLLWDDAGGRLLWSYGNWYAASHQNNPVLGATVLNPDGTVTVQGTWRTTVDSQQTRSFAVFLSRALSAAAGGDTLALGGRLQSINGSASWGPSLNAIDFPGADSAGAQVATRVLASHPITPTSQRSTRTADYQVARNPDGSLDSAGTEPVVSGVGYWTELDETTGAVFVTTGSGSRTALVYTGSQASGLIWYGPDHEHGVADGRGYNGSGNHAEAYRPVLWFVSEADLVAAAAGTLAPSAVNPYATVDLTAQFPELAALTGLTAGQPVFAADEGRLYVPFGGALIEGRAPYPLIAVFSVAN